LSTFAVEIKQIEKIEGHKNADRLELGKVCGLDYTFVIPKGKYIQGDLVVYFPPDSVIPKNLIDSLEMKNLAGEEQNRVKTVCLRGVYSQGIVEPLKSFIDLGILSGEEKEDQDVTKTLGVVKYEQDPIELKDCTLIRLPEGLSTYDIEGYERYPEETEILMNTPCMVTEKIEGANFSVTVCRDGCRTFVNQASYSIVEHKGYPNIYWNSARTDNIIPSAMGILFKLEANTVTLYGELAGPGTPQRSNYKLEHPTTFLFDIKVENEYIDCHDFLSLCREFGLKTVPILSLGKTLSEWIKIEGKETLSDASNGKSKVNPDVLREGVVIKPLMEMRTPALGRVILKKRSPEYLSKE
jgi:RNA ligase (TIGR02306 family)